MENVSESGKLNNTEMLRSFRDIFLASLSVLLPQILDVLNNTDLNNPYLNLWLFVVIVILNRIYNIIRI